jgi:Leucine Rich repeat
MNTPSSDDLSRPDFMATLGLLPPYTLSDVIAAYRLKALETHPDRGGTKADFLKIHEAYRQAVEFVQFDGDRRKWIADQVECHLRQQEVVAVVDRLRGQTEVKEPDWMRPCVGDFIVLADRLCVVDLQNTSVDDAFLSFLAGPTPRAPYLTDLNLAGTRVTDKGLQALTGLSLLQRLDLSGTKVTSHGLRAVIESLTSLEWVGVAGSGVGCLSRWRLHRLLHGREGEHRRMRSLLSAALDRRKYPL